MSENSIPTDPFTLPTGPESANVPPIPAPGYPQNDIPPTTMRQVPNLHQEIGAPLEAQYRDSQLAQLAAENAELLARLEALEKPKPVKPVSTILGGEPVAHHLHLTDGRVIQDHGGIGTHYSETLPDGSTKVTRIREYYPAEELDPTPSLG